jgi:predicted enzyme related to lactoylglutathione lyase
MDHTIVHFEIPAGNVEKLAKFYEQLFAWKIIHSPVEGMDYWVIQTVPTDDKGMPQKPGVNRGMYPKQPEQKDAKPVNYTTVENIDEYIKKSHQARRKNTCAKTASSNRRIHRRSHGPRRQQFRIATTTNDLNHNCNSQTSFVSQVQKD